MNRFTTDSTTPTALTYISRITAILVSMLALGSFALSFDALHSFAMNSGALSPSWAWLFPLVVDGSIVVFSVGALRSSLVGEDGRWSMTLVIVATLASVIFNVAHAPGGVVTCLVSATPPIFLFLSFETAMRQVRQSIATVPPILHETAHSVRLLKPAPRARLQPKNPTSNRARDAARSEALRLLSEGISKRSVARQTKLALSTVRRLAEGMSAPAVSGAKAH